MSNVQILGWSEATGGQHFDVTYIDALIGKTWWDGRALFFRIAEQYRKSINCAHGNVSSVISGKKGLNMLVTWRSTEQGLRTLPLRSRKKIADAIAAAV